MQAFDFNADDLAANQQGKLTTRQQQMIIEQVRQARTRSFIAVLAFLGSVLLFVGIAIFAKQGPIPEQAFPYLAGTAFLFFAIVSLFIFIGLRRLHDLRAEKITAIKGPIHLTTKRIKNGRWIVYYAQIGDIRFQLSSERQFTTLAEGNIYQIYFIHYPPTHLILSVADG